ncbi:MAG: peptidoglycan editing factor PgeF [Clostridia bacterium]|nr:peptidoglycan editing factor PgeF [Clostridia bacterium]
MKLTGGEVGLLRVDDARWADVCAAFTTRMGGVSEGPLSSMNLGFGRGDSPQNVEENYRRLGQSLGMDPFKAVMTRQVHEDTVRCVTQADAGQGLSFPIPPQGADALVTDCSDLPLIGFWADCVPILLYDPQRGCVAAVHSGWRGTALKIASKTVRTMALQYHSDPQHILAAIGPSIGPCCYEVGAEVREAMPDFASCFREKANGKYMADLWQINRLILLEAGLREENIETAKLCTCCHSELFFSHRASGGKRGACAMVIMKQK